MVMFAPGALDRDLSFEEAVAERVFCPLGEGVVDFAALAGARLLVWGGGWLKKQGTPSELVPLEA